MVEQLLIIEMAEQDSVEILDKDIDKALNQQIEILLHKQEAKNWQKQRLVKKFQILKDHIEMI